MTHVRSPLLRGLIAIDAVACAASGALLAFAAEPLATITGLAPDLTRPAGVFLLAWTLVLATAASRPTLSRAAVWTLIAVNVIWVVESALVLLLGWAQPTAAGYGFVIAQAVAVAAIAELQFVALRRAATVA
ncbi:hypothetical protein [Phenylobacterium sp.]|uniref:hypothetical protein n=1 Tax=Phenylobacterium sp. TaxID=1871053 RepID=UPI0035AF7925